MNITIKINSQQRKPITRYLNKSCFWTIFLLFLVGCADMQTIEICGRNFSSGDKLPIKSDKAKDIQNFKSALSQINNDNYNSICQNILAGGAPLICPYYSMGLRVKNNEIVLSSVSQMLNAKASINKTHEELQMFSGVATSSTQSFDEYIGGLCPYLE